MYTLTQTEVSDILQISEGMSTNVSKKRKIEGGNLQKVIHLNIKYGFDQQRLIWYVCRLWDMIIRCLADVSSVSPSSEQNAPTKG